MATLEDGWTVWVDVEDSESPAVGEAALVLFGQLFEPHFGVVGGGAASGRYNARFALRVTGLGEQDALTQGVALFRRLASEARLPPFPVVWAEVMTFGEQDRQLATRTRALRPQQQVSDDSRPGM